VLCSFHALCHCIVVASINVLILLFPEIFTLPLHFGTDIGYLPCTFTNTQLKKRYVRTTTNIDALLTLNSMRKSINIELDIMCHISSLEHPFTFFARWSFYISRLPVDYATTTSSPFAIRAVGRDIRVLRSRHIGLAIRQLCL
jgi:hypothetical protein